MLLSQNENGVSVKEICKREKISEATYYNWKKLLHFEELASENKRLRAIIEKQESYSRVIKTKLPEKSKAVSPLLPDMSVPGNEEAELLDLLSSVIAEIAIKDICREAR